MTLSSSQLKDSVGSAISVSMVRYGFVFLKRWLATTASEDIVRHCGRALTFGKDNPVHRVVPKAEAAQNTYSGIYGLKAFPFHNDMAHWRRPPRYMMLRCVKGHESVATFLMDGFAIVAHAGEANLVRALVKPRRPLNGVLPLLSLFRRQNLDDAALIRWDEKFIVPASSAGEEGMRLVRKAFANVTETKISLSEPGDTLWIDNWRILHARGAVAHDQCDRILERAYFGELF